MTGEIFKITTVGVAVGSKTTFFKLGLKIDLEVGVGVVFRVIFGIMLIFNPEVTDGLASLGVADKLDSADSYILVGTGVTVGSSAKFKELFLPEVFIPK